MFAVITLGFVVFKTVSTVLKKKPRVYKCKGCGEKIERGLGVFIDKQTYCRDCVKKIL